MSIYQEYNETTGGIISTMIIPDKTAEAAVEHGAKLIKGEGDSQTHYVDIQVNPPVLRLRPAQDTVQDKFRLRPDGEDTLTLDNLPIPCRIFFNDYSYDVDDGILKWCTTRPDSYKISVKAFPFLDYESEVIVNAG